MHRAVASGLMLVVIFTGAFAVGRTGGQSRSRPDPIRLVDGIPVGVLHSAAGALTAADNYVATGVSDSLDERALASFARVDVAPGLRASLLTTNEQLARRSIPAGGTKALGLVVAHRLRGYSGDVARVTTWDVGDYWGPDLEPNQYWAQSDLSLRWSAGRWQIASLQERVPGPVPARLALGPNTTAEWNAALAGMTLPYYVTR